MAVGIFTLPQSEFTKLAQAHVKLYADGVEVTGGRDFPTGTVLRADTYENYMFTDANYPPDDGYDDFGFEIAAAIEGVMTSVKFTPMKTPEGKYSRSYTIVNDSKISYLQRIYIHTAVDPNPPKPKLEWNVHPATGTPNTDIAFSWKGGDPGANGYNFVVIAQDGTTIVDDQNTATLTANLNEAAGIYTVHVYDKGGRTDPTASHIQQAVTLETALAWVTHPNAAQIGTPVTYEWEGGAGGYVFIALYPDGVSEAIRHPQTGTTTDTSYAATFPNFEGNYTVQVWTPNDGNKHIDQAVAVAAAPTAPLAWDVHPSTAVTGVPTRFSWKDGKKPATGYWVKITAPDGTTPVDKAVDALEYTETFTQVGDYNVQVYDQVAIDNHTPISQKVTVSAPSLYVFSAGDYSAMRQAGVTLKVNNVEVNGAVNLKEGDTLQFSCEQDYKFFEDVHGSSVGFTLSDNSRAEFTLDPTDKHADYTMVDKKPLTYSALYITTRKIPNATGVNRVYYVTKQNINDLNAGRFAIVENSNNSAMVAVDYGNNIVNLIELPFNIDPAMVGLDDTIMLGSHDSHIIAPNLIDDKLDFYLGKIQVPATYNNSLDYLETKALLHIPFSNPIALDLEYVIGQTVSVVMVVSVYTGRATVLVSSSALNDVVVMKELDAGFNVPYANRGSATNTNIDIGGDNNLRQPYIELVRNDAHLPNGIFSAIVKDEDILGHFKGFVIVEEIELNTPALKNEKDEIMSFLHNGVIIK